MIINNTDNELFNDVDKLSNPRDMQQKNLKMIKANDFINTLFELINEEVNKDININN